MVRTNDAALVEGDEVSGQKKLVDMSREELFATTLAIIKALNHKSRDLPRNAAANARHQRMKHAWGRKKKELLELLSRTLIHVPHELAEEIRYALSHDEFLWQRRKRIKTTIRKLKHGPAISQGTQLQRENKAAC